MEKNKKLPKLPKEGVLHKLVDKKPNINIMNFYKKVKS